MATRKQQKRRHQRTVGRGRVYGPEGSAPREPEKKGRGSSRAREPQPPSWRRTARRALLFAALFLLASSFLPFFHMTANSRIFSAIYLFLMFWMVGTLTETWAWRRHLKRQGQSPP